MSKSMLRISGQPIVRIIYNRLKGVWLHPVHVCVLEKELPDYKFHFRDEPDVRLHSESDVVSTGTTYSKAAKEAGIHEGDEVMIHYGDTLLKFDHDKLRRAWEWAKFHDGAQAMIVCSSNIRHDYSEVHIDAANSMVVQMIEKPKLQYPSWTGILIMKQYFDTNGLDFGFNILPHLVMQKKLAAFLSPEEYYDTGNVKAYQRLVNMARKGEFEI